jgi:phosphoserine aminotransferase
MDGEMNYMGKRVFNFNPGPAGLPLPVLEKVRDELLDYAGTGMSVLEISHRSKEYEKINQDAIDLLHSAMGLPNDYKVLWLGGGASTQFFMVPVNLQVSGKPMEYAVTGTWSQKAMSEAKLYGDAKAVISSEDKKFSYIPKNAAFSANAGFAHMTMNETIHGVEWSYIPQVPKEVPLVCDMSSDFLSRVVDPKKFGVIYAGAQKNFGPAGVCVVIVREDLLTHVPEKVPSMLKWSTHAKENSLYNTPPVFAVYICKLWLEYMKQLGGIPAIEKTNIEKARIIYDIIDKSKGFYKGHAQADSRSRMNVTFRLANEQLEEKCANEATAKGLIGLKGHRSVGGMRASLYNAVTIEGTKALAEFLKDFQAKNQ